MKVPSIRAPTNDREPLESEPDATAASQSPPRPAAGSPFGYVRQLWRAEIPLSSVFWQDMILIGTVVNLAAMGLAFVAVALGASTATGIAIHLSPVPYNILLVASVWQRAAAEPSSWGPLARLGALAWLLIAFVV